MPIQSPTELHISAVRGTARQESLRLCLIATYFGPLPFSFQLWLHSCAANPEIQFLVVSDQSPDQYRLPENVRFEHSTLSKVRDVFSAKLGVSVALTNPYKICDFRPFFWIIVDWLGITCSHWGHCDLDVIFGDLHGLIHTHLACDYDRLFELGHLSIYRNCDLVNSVCFSKHSGARWKDVITSDVNFGFDEHNGVNLAWEALSLRWYRDQHICFDVEPRIAAIQTCQFGFNHNRQAVYWENGHLFHAFRTLTGRVRIREIGYVHFQKRQLLPQLCQDAVLAFALTPDSIEELSLDPNGTVGVKKLLSSASTPSLKEKATVTLNTARNIKARAQLQRRAKAAL